jgi:hypothetical protein
VGDGLRVSAQAEWEDARKDKRLEGGGDVIILGRDRVSSSLSCLVI